MTKDIEIRSLTKRFPKDGGIHTVFSDLSLVIPEGKITVLLGKSGCGKTTLLRLIAGLDTDYEGEIHRDKDAKFGVVFQEPRLMPWLSVRKNIAFGLKKSPETEKKTEDLIDLTGLRGFENVRPAALSGGMEQRTALARALAQDPEFLLMDEPFAALDYFTRSRMQEALLALHRKTACGVLFITHSIDEAVLLGDRIVILKDQNVRKVYSLPEKAAAAGPSPEAVSALKEDILIHIN